MAIDKVWTDLEWHPEVHVRLGEHLHYYLVRVRPFRAQDVESKLDEFLKGSDISSLRVFMIFGPMDLLVRVWLNPRQAGTFHTALSSALSGADVRPFFVNKIVHRSHVPLEVSTRLLDTLDDSSIRAVQNGQDETLREDLLRDGLIVQRRNNSAGVKFFVGVSLALNSPEITNHAIKKIESYLADQNSLVMPSIYVGVGFCDILVKADADETFFSLGDFVLWLGQELRTFHPTTDTYISAQPGTLVEVPDTISDTTFRVFEGESLFARSFRSCICSSIRGSGRSSSSSKRRSPT
jgi:hypothetical protein